jgi:hypothetical protein
MAGSGAQLSLAAPMAPHPPRSPAAERPAWQFRPPVLPRFYCPYGGARRRAAAVAACFPAYPGLASHLRLLGGSPGGSARGQRAAGAAIGSCGAEFHASARGGGATAAFSPGPLVSRHPAIDPTGRPAGRGLRGLAPVTAPSQASRQGGSRPVSRACARPRAPSRPSAADSRRTRAPGPRRHFRLLGATGCGPALPPGGPGRLRSRQFPEIHRALSGPLRIRAGVDHPAYPCAARQRQCRSTR